jgi:ABC-2 type transport system permease protein
MPLALLSGLSIPISNMPREVQVITLFNPLRYALSIGHRGALLGATLQDIFPDLWPLPLVSLTIFAIARLDWRPGSSSHPNVPPFTSIAFQK